MPTIRRPPTVASNFRRFLATGKSSTKVHPGVLGAAEFRGVALPKKKIDSSGHPFPNAFPKVVYSFPTAVATAIL